MRIITLTKESNKWKITDKHIRDEVIEAETYKKDLSTSQLIRELEHIFDTQIWQAGT